MLYELFGLGDICINVFSTGYKKECNVLVACTALRHLLGIPLIWAGLAL